MIRLNWPREGAREIDGNRFVQSGSNICPDLHGDPVAARLTVFSDGNHLNIDLEFLDGQPPPRLVYGENIHHREAPQAVADGRADVAVVFHHLALRYTRIFPDLFEIVPLTEAGLSDPGQVRRTTHIGLVGDGGEWGAQLLTFLLSESVAGIYRYHGLERANREPSATADTA